MRGILTRYVLAEILRTFVAALLVFSMIFLIGSLYELVSKSASLRQIALVVPYVLVYTLPFLLPVALLVGCALAYGRLAADNEILPVLSGGIPASQLAAPAILLGIFLSGLLYGLEGSLIPHGWMKKKDMVRSWVEQLTNLGTGQDKAISDEDTFHFYCRRFDGAEVFGVEVVYVPDRGGGRVVLTAPGSGLESGRPTEIVAVRGKIVRDEIRDTIELHLFEVEFTQWEAPKEVAPPGSDDGLPPRGRAHHGRLAEARLAIPIDWRLRDKTEFRSAVYLREYLERLGAYERFARDPGAQHAARVPAAAAILGSLVAPGGGPGALGLGFATLGAASPGPGALADALEKRREAQGYIHGRISLALAPLLFALIGAAIPLRLRHNNRLLPFLIAFAIVAVTFFVPWLSARGLVDEARGAPGYVYYIAPALTLAVGLALHADLRRH